MIQTKNIAVKVVHPYCSNIIKNRAASRLVEGLCVNIPPNDHKRQRKKHYGSSQLKAER